MQLIETQDLQSGQTLEESIDYIFTVLRSFIAVNTIFVAVNDGMTNTVLKAFNQVDMLVEEGLQLPLSMSYCQLVFQHSESFQRTLVIANTEEHPATCGLDITRTLGACSFIGVPIKTLQQPQFGTLCAIDRKPYTFTEKEISLLEAMALYLGNLVQLENSHHQLRRLTDQNYLLLNSVSEGIYGIDLEGHTTFWNAAAERITGYSASEMIGTSNHARIHHTHSNGCPYPLMDCPIFRAIGSTETRHIEGELFWHKNGSGFPVDYTINPIVDSNTQNPVGLVVTFNDVSGKLQTEEMLRKSEKLSVVGQMAAGVAHEIRNPLTAVNGFAKLIRKRAPELSGYFDIMLEELNRIETIVNEFLFISKPQIHDFQSKDIKEILRGLLPILESQAILGNVLLRLKVGEGVVPEVLCDESRLKQVFINILRNSIEAMPSGGNLYICLIHDAAQAAVRIVVRDEGIGIAKERLAKIGEPFYTTKEVGTGLGLMVSQKIIEAHRGKFRIESEVGKGTTVTIELPI